MSIEYADNNGDAMDMTGDKSVSHRAMTEHPDAYLFEDIFPADMPTLTDLLANTMHSTGWPNDVEVPVYRLSGQYYPGHSMTVEPQTYHQMIGQGGSAAEIVTTAISHHQKLRELGMTVVGHQFEIVRTDDTRFATIKDHPTVIAGAKLAHLPPQKGPTKAPAASTRLVGINKELLDDIKMDQHAFVAAIVNPLEAYLQWCGDDGQEYVLSELTNTLHYFHHTKTGRIALQRVSSSLGSIELGNLEFRKKDLELFKAHLRKQGILA